MTGNNLCTMIPDDASAIAEEIMEQCGIKGMKQSEVLALEWQPFDYSAPESIVESEYDGYAIKYSREVNGTQVYQGKLDNIENLSIDNVRFNNPVEDFTVYINDNGLIQVHWTVLFLETGKGDHDVKLLS